MFGQLGPDLFTVLSGGNRLLYEKAILAIYNQLFRSELLFPTQAEVVGAIYDCLSQDPGLWAEEEAAVDLDLLLRRGGRRVRRRGLDGVDREATGSAINRSRHIYNRLLQAGWLDEVKYGLKVTVEMPAGAMRLTEFLCSMKEGVAEQLGGLVIEVRNAIRAVREKPEENALGLHKAARDAASFRRYLRSVLSALREVDRQVLSSDTLAERLKYYFEEFVERVLLRDYAAIATTAHPYRHRREILSALDALEDSAAGINAIAEAYAEARLAPSGARTQDLVHDDLAGIRHVFERIEAAFEAIQEHRARLETKLRNVVRYAGRRTNFLRRSDALISGLDRLLGAEGGERVADGAIEPRIPVLAPHLLATPRRLRAGIAANDVLIPPVDPLQTLRRALERDYLDRLIVTPAKICRFLEARIAPFGKVQAAGLKIESIDDFLVFDALRMLASGGGGTVEKRFEVTPAPGGVVENEWLACGDFVIRRLDGPVVLEIENAG